MGFTIETGISGFDSIPAGDTELFSLHASVRWCPYTWDIFPEGWARRVHPAAILQKMTRRKAEESVCFSAFCFLLWASVPRSLFSGLELRRRVHF